VNGRQLVIQWIAGLACVLVLGIGTPEWMRRGIEQFIPGAAARRQQVEAARRDSLLAAVALAARRAVTDSGTRAPADSARAAPQPPAAAAGSPAPSATAADSTSATNEQPDPPPSELELRIARLLVLIGVPLALLWSTYRWWKQQRVTRAA
jgi:hypothetical protein